MLLCKVAIIATLITAPANNIFAVKKQFDKTGLTPQEERIKNEEAKKLRKQNMIQNETAEYGEGYTVVSREHSLFLNKNTHKIFILGKEYDFKDIIGISINSIRMTTPYNATSTVRTNTGSLIGRAALGHMVAGNLGTIIGASTATKTIETNPSGYKDVFDYSVIINVNNLDNPIVTIHTGFDSELTNQIYSTLNVIVNMNNNPAR